MAPPARLLFKLSLPLPTLTVPTLTVPPPARSLKMLAPDSATVPLLVLMAAFR